jgi:hypothetical protein
MASCAAGMNHNELVGWAGGRDNLAVVILRTKPIMGAHKCVLNSVKKFLHNIRLT